MVQELHRKGPLGRPLLSWEDDIKMDLKEIGCDCGVALYGCKGKQATLL
jgi:hypothetical protein